MLKAVKRTISSRSNNKDEVAKDSCCICGKKVYFRFHYPLICLILSFLVDYLDGFCAKHFEEFFVLRPSRRQSCSLISSFSLLSFLSSNLTKNQKCSERVTADSKLYHQLCFKCSVCKRSLQPSNYSSHEGKVYCKAHYSKVMNEHRIQPTLNPAKKFFRLCRSPPLRVYL